MLENQSVRRIGDVLMGIIFNRNRCENCGHGRDLHYNNNCEMCSRHNEKYCICPSPGWED